MTIGQNKYAAMKLLLLILSFFLVTTVQAQTYAPYSGNKANGTKVAKQDKPKTENTKPVVTEKPAEKVPEKPQKEESKKAKDEFEDFMIKAAEQLHQKDYQKALGFYTQALEVSTKESAHMPLVSRATLYAIMNEDEKAMADLTKAIEIKGTPQKQLAIIYRMRARLYANNKKMDLACKDVAKAKALGASDTAIEGIDCN